MDREDVKKLITEKYSSEIADDTLGDWIDAHFPEGGIEDYINKLPELIEKKLPEKEFGDQAMLLAWKCGYVIID